MTSTKKAPFFSIVIATRDRPELVQVALNSVLEQSFSDREIIVVIDGSSDSNLARYREIQKTLDGVTFTELNHRPNGHGQSYAINCGVQLSSGQYLCFLDDDDHWTDKEYLGRLFQSLTSSNKQVDMHYSNQIAVFSSGLQKTGHVWIDDLIPRVSSLPMHHEDSYYVDTTFLLSSCGFAHINCSVFRREFFNTIGEMDENIRYENDRDIYIRSLDSANVILFSTRYMSVHNIPDMSKKNNMSTVSSDIEKKLFQLRVYDKGISLSKNPEVADFSRKAKMYELKNTTTILVRNKQYKSAAYYARSALSNGFNFRWLAYTIYLSILAVFSKNAFAGRDAP